MFENNSQSSLFECLKPNHSHEFSSEKTVENKYPEITVTKVKFQIEMAKAYRTRAGGFFPQKMKISTVKDRETQCTHTHIWYSRLTNITHKKWKPVFRPKFPSDCISGKWHIVENGCENQYYFLCVCFDFVCS